ncbi:uncharacterized protein LOC120621692 [Pteropus medius]|uniref:uncharacterized protein LOC120621692 n=1 Tax=Pteropus vampyrus TaxID=132908 RepID=UPI00196A50EB|nr:uncharacterized protein LOC120621692 [Pteropus giganteus]XP_039743199.1 uncharacterized protein LOC120621692 [Pteropus giganteus]
MILLGAKFLKIHKPHSQPSRRLLGKAAPRRSQRSGGARSPESHIRAGSESGWPPLGLGAQAGTGRCAAPRRGRDCDSARPHLLGAGARPPRSQRPRSRLPLARRLPAVSPPRSLLPPSVCERVSLPLMQEMRKRRQNVCVCACVCVRARVCVCVCVYVFVCTRARAPVFREIESFAGWGSNTGKVSRREDERERASLPGWRRRAGEPRGDRAWDPVEWRRWGPGCGYLVFALHRRGASGTSLQSSVANSVFWNSGWGSGGGRTAGEDSGPSPSPTLTWAAAGEGSPRSIGRSVCHSVQRRWAPRWWGRGTGRGVQSSVCVFTHLFSFLFLWGHLPFEICPGLLRLRELVDN